MTALPLDRVGRDQRGWALVTSVLVLGLILMVGLATLKVVDTQSGESRKQRERESAFNMAEAALGNQIFVLSRNWPGTAANAYSVTCGPATSGAQNQCPVDSVLRANFTQGGDTQPDFAVPPSWSTSVWDDGSCGGVDYTRYYRESLTTCSGATRWDSNANDQVWVRAEATVRGRRRVLVGRAAVQRLPIPFPRIVVQAGHMTLGNNKNMDVNGSGTSIELRCGTAGSSMPADGVPGCADFTTGQLTNTTVSFGYQQTSAVAAPTRAALKAAAIAEGHYCKDPLNTAPGATPSSPGFCDSAGCPTAIGNPAGTKPGWIVWLDGVTATCKYTGGNDWNSRSNPGIFVVDHGTSAAVPQLYMGGNGTFYGVIYMVNSNNLTGDLYQQKGNGTMVGAVAVDGPGGVDLGNSNNTRILYDPNVLGALTTTGAAAIVQNTWRQIN